MPRGGIRTFSALLGRDGGLALVNLGRIGAALQLHRTSSLLGGHRDWELRNASGQNGHVSESGGAQGKRDAALPNGVGSLSGCMAYLWIRVDLLIKSAELIKVDLSLEMGQNFTISEREAQKEATVVLAGVS